MALQFTRNGDALATNVGAGVTFQNALLPSSVTCWINAPWAGNAGAQSYVGMYDEQQRASLNTSTAIQIGSRSGAGKLDIWTWGGGILITSTATLVPGNWYFVAYTYNGTTHSVYVNGLLAGTSTTTQRAGAFDRVYLNGYTNGRNSETSTFSLDTYTYFNRLLTADEIRTMYTASGARHGILYNSVVQYKFQDGATGSAVTVIRNQTDFQSTYSDLFPVVPAGSIRVTLISSYASANLRQST